MQFIVSHYQINICTLIGEFTVDAQTLSSPPQEYLCRTVREDWVVEIRNKIREQAAIPQGTHLPVLVDPSQVLLNTKI